MNTNRRRMSLALVAVLPAVGTAGVASVFSARAAESPGPLRIDLPRFSTNLPGKRLPAGWAHQPLPSVERRNSFDLLAEDDGSVLRVTSDRSASSLAVSLRVDAAATPLLRWRWWVSHALAGSDLRRKAGDDYAARVYVLFDLPLDRLSLGDRMKISAARLLHSAELPAAALCYVWGTAQVAGETGWNAYTDRLRMIVVIRGMRTPGSGGRSGATLLPIFATPSALRCRLSRALRWLPIPTTRAARLRRVLVISGSRRAGRAHGEPRSALAVGGHSLLNLLDAGKDPAALAVAGLDEVPDFVDRLGRGRLVLADQAGEAYADDIA